MLLNIRKILIGDRFDYANSTNLVDKRLYSFAFSFFLTAKEQRNAKGNFINYCKIEAGFEKNERPVPFFHTSFRVEGCDSKEQNNTCFCNR